MCPWGSAELGSNQRRRPDHVITHPLHIPNTPKAARRRDPGSVIRGRRPDRSGETLSSLSPHAGFPPCTCGEKAAPASWTAVPVRTGLGQMLGLFPATWEE